MEFVIKDITGTDIAIWNSGRSISADEILATFCTMCVNEQVVANANEFTAEEVEETETQYQGKTVVESSTKGYVIAIIVLAVLLTISLMATAYMAYLKKIEKNSKAMPYNAPPSAQSMSIMSSSGQIPVVLSSPNNLNSLDSS